MESQNPRDNYNRITEHWEIITMESQSPGKLSQWNHRALGEYHNGITEPWESITME